MSDISKLKRKKTTILESLQKQDEEFSKKKTFRDDRYWQPVTDKNHNGSAIIRFLPGILIPGTDDETENPVVRMWQHGFKGPTGLWYIENSRNTLTDGTNSGEGRDPVTTFNNQLWNSGDEDKREQASKQKRKLVYVSNIYVIKHPGRPEDEGKVFLYKYGQKIYDKLKKMLNPPDDDGDGKPDTPPVNVFDFWEGANFRLRVKNVKGFRNYDDSTFDAPKPLFEDDAELEPIFKLECSLLAEIAPDKFKPYEELEKRLWEVLGHDQDGVVVEQRERHAPVSSSNDEEEPPFDTDDDPKPTTQASKSDMSNFFDNLKKRANKG